MQVDNAVANELLIAARKGERLQDFMDAISGVENYDIKNIRRQGHIRSMFAKELISEQFLIDFEDIISVFWQGVFEYLDKAKLYGDVVDIKTPGKEHESRPTKNNPMHYLRYHGRMAARNYISYLYRRNLEQGCNSCGFKTTVRSDKECPRCSSQMTTIYKFSDVESEDIISKDINKIIEDNEIGNKMLDLLDSFAENELKAGTRAYQILKILINPSESKAMCSSCCLCDSKNFDIESCTNYNANIGKWLGVNKTMIASKIKRIRTALPKWLDKQNQDEAKYMLEILPIKFK